LVIDIAPTWNRRHPRADEPSEKGQRPMGGSELEIAYRLAFHFTTAAVACLAAPSGCGLPEPALPRVCMASRLVAGLTIALLLGVTRTCKA
jgi:hypothetical protein